MGKVESNKSQKRISLLNTAFALFTSQGVNKTSIADIASQAGIAKGTFYLYFKDKYDIRNKLISHESSKLFRKASEALEAHLLSPEGNDMQFADKIIFIIDYIINSLDENKALLTFISKNLSWGIFKEALTTNVSPDDINFRDVFLEMVAAEDDAIIDPEIMLFLIIELASSVAYSSILYREPADIHAIKPHLYTSIRSIIANHMR